MMKVRVFLQVLGVYLSVNEHLQRNFLFTNPAFSHLGVPCIYKKGCRSFEKGIAELHNKLGELLLVSVQKDMAIAVDWIGR